VERFNVSAWGLRNGALTVFAMLALAVAGALAYLQLGRAEDPSFTLKSMVVSAAWPGATAEEMQALVANRIESRLQDLRSLDVLRTYVRPGVAVVTVQLRDDTPPRDVPGLWYEVRKKVGDIRGLLPAGIVGLAFNDEFPTFSRWCWHSAVPTTMLSWCGRPKQSDCACCGFPGLRKWQLAASVRSAFS